MTKLNVIIQVLTSASMKVTASGMLHRVVSQKFTYVSEVLTATITRAMIIHRLLADGGSEYRCIVGQLLQHYTA
jgi:hypothetical protein